MAQRFLLDTSALLAHHRREQGWSQVQQLFEASNVEILAASVSLTEFARRLCALGATKGDARQAVEAYAELLDEVAAIGKDVALAAFELGCQTSPRLPLTDALIAATARRCGACLVHRDSHMAPISSSFLSQLDLSSEPSPENRRSRRERRPNRPS